MGKKTIKIFINSDEAHEDDKEYYQSLTPVKRLQIVEELRQSYYENNSQGFPRVLEIINSHYK